MTVAAEEPLDLLADYRREPRGYDEAVDDARAGRAARTPARCARSRATTSRRSPPTVDEQVAGEGVCFHSAGGDEAFVIDPVPRVLDAQEWEAIEAGPRASACARSTASSPTSTPAAGSSTRASCPSA